MFGGKGTFIPDMSAHLFQRQLHFNRNFQRQKSKEFLVGEFQSQGKSDRTILGSGALCYTEALTEKWSSLARGQPWLSHRVSMNVCFLTECTVVISAVGLINKRLWVGTRFLDKWFTLSKLHLSLVLLELLNPKYYKLVLFQNAKLLLKCIQL